MSKLGPYIFVLWSDNFEEVAATVFVTELRRMGLRVKVVGLSRQHISGAYGLALVPDVTLEEAMLLTDQTHCLIVPCPPHILHRLQYDPRLSLYFDQLRVNPVIIIIGPFCDSSSTDLMFLSLSPEDVLTYPQGEALASFAREIGRRLLASS